MTNRAYDEAQTMCAPPAYSRLCLEPQGERKQESREELSRVQVLGDRRIGVGRGGGVRQQRGRSPAANGEFITSDCLFYLLNERVSYVIV